MSRTRTARIALAATALFVLAACGDSGTTTQSAVDPPPGTATPTSMPATTEATPVHGSWQLDLTADQLRATLIRTGFGAQAEQFLRVEEVTKGLNQVLTVKDSSFAFAYQAPDKTWYVGWQGRAEVTGDELRLTEDDAPGGVRADVLRWSVEGDELRLQVVQASDMVIKGIASEAFLQAYLASAPFTRTSCAPTETSCT